MTGRLFVVNSDKCAVFEHLFEYFDYRSDRLHDLPRLKRGTMVALESGGDYGLPRVRVVDERSHMHGLSFTVDARDISPILQDLVCVGDFNSE